MDDDAFFPSCVKSFLQPIDEGLCAFRMISICCIYHNYLVIHRSQASSAVDEKLNSPSASAAAFFTMSVSSRSPTTVLTPSCFSRRPARSSPRTRQVIWTSPPRPSSVVRVVPPTNPVAPTRSYGKGSLVGSLNSVLSRAYYLYSHRKITGDGIEW